MDNFVVSARKYRPVTFESVVGQGHITSTLRNAIVGNQLAHAYLFCGPRGVGKTTCARILAKSINCLNPNETAEPCGECESCIAFQDSRSFNIHELDAASNNSVNDIRALTEQVRIPPQIGKYSIYIIDEAHMLSTAAFNAFLKTLEEPPAYAIFILATTEKHKLIPTILSRCQIYDFKRIKASDLVGYLKFISKKEGVSYDEESLFMIAEKADGCMRDALSMYDKVVSFCGSKLTFKEVAEALNILDYDTYFNFIDSVKEGDYASALLIFDQVLQKGFDANIFLGGLASHLRNLLVAKTPQTLSLLEVTGGVAERFAAQSRRCEVSFIFDSLSLISSGEYGAKSANSIRLHTELTILKICNLSPLKLSGGSLSTQYTLPQISSNPTPNNTATPSAQPQSSAPKEPQQVVKQEVATTPQPTTPPTPEAQSNRVAPNPQQPTAGAGQRTSTLGISINPIKKKIEQQESEKIEEAQTEEVIEVEEFGEKESIKLLEASREYADSVAQSRPRIAVAFQDAEVVDGKLMLRVTNDIISEEILNEKHIYTSKLSEISGLKGVDIIVMVQPLEAQQLLPVRDEDKLKFLTNINPEISTLRRELDLI